MTRRSDPTRPTAARRPDMSPRGASGPAGAHPDGPGVERVRGNGDEDEPLIPRSGEDRRTTPRRYEQPADDPAMPSNDPSLNTKI